MIGYSQVSSAVTITGEHLYQEMSTEEKQGLETSLNSQGLELGDYLNTKISFDEETNKIGIDPDFPTYYRKNGGKPPNYKFKRWVYSGGISYLFPIGFGVTGDIDLQNKRGDVVFKSQFSAETTGTFLRGSAQTYEWSPQVQFGKVKLHVGPVFQMIQVYNPMLFGQQNFFYRAMGLNIGYAFQKVIHERRWSIDLYGQVTAGGFNNNPTPFMLVGGGLRVTVSNKIMKAKRGSLVQ